MSNHLGSYSLFWHSLQSPHTVPPSTSRPRLSRPTTNQRRLSYTGLNHSNGTWDATSLNCSPQTWPWGAQRKRVIPCGLNLKGGNPHPKKGRRGSSQLCLPNRSMGFPFKTWGPICRPQLDGDSWNVVAPQLNGTRPKGEGIPQKVAKPTSVAFVFGVRCPLPMVLFGFGRAASVPSVR